MTYLKGIHHPGGGGVLCTNVHMGCAAIRLKIAKTRYYM